MSKNLLLKRLNDNAVIPTRGSSRSAGLDLYVDTDKTIEIMPSERVMLSTGIAVAIPDGYFGAIFARSGIAFREGIRPSNCVGVIDSDYTGEIKVAITNDSDEIRKINKHDRIAQLVVIPYEHVDIIEVEDLDETERGAGGFGHTGV